MSLLLHARLLLLAHDRPELDEAVLESLEADAQLLVGHLLCLHLCLELLAEPLLEPHEVHLLLLDLLDLRAHLVDALLELASHLLHVLAHVLLLLLELLAESHVLGDAAAAQRLRLHALQLLQLRHSQPVELRPAELRHPHLQHVHVDCPLLQIASRSLVLLSELSDLLVGCGQLGLEGSVLLLLLLQALQLLPQMVALLLGGLEARFDARLLQLRAVD
mmetsp:Transcript_10568/g.24888  ORF Transcript_10568/g.24888 Transcript_10568/m.24888 type:complete len:219 (-) Transcript_10568:293-949(-)